MIDMKRAMTIVLAGTLALAVGCANKSTTKHASADWKSNTWTTETTATETTTPANVDSGTDESAAAAQPPTAESAKWVGAWQLAAPRHETKDASISADGKTVVIKAGELTGTYLVQGNFLLAYTRDERMRPVAWRINSDDSITIVRPPDLGPGSHAFTGITMLRAADSSMTEADMGELPVP